MAFDIRGAREAGYSDDEIAEYLARESNFDLGAARDEGYSPAEVIDYLKAKEPKPKESSTFRRIAGDAAISLAKGVVGVPEAAVGLADLVTGGAVGKAAEDAGIRFKDTKAALSELYTPEQKEANKRVDQAKGFVDTASAMLQNPSTIAQSAIESAPSMLAGGVIGRGALAAAPKLSPIIAGAMGEGAVSAGQTAEQIRQENKSGTLGTDQALLAAGSGLLTGAIGAGSGKVAAKLGLADVDTLLAKGAPAATKAGIVRRLTGGAITEGVFEELPQSTQEQIAQNLATGKPWDEGVAKAGVQGMLTGGLMGAGAGMVPGPRPTVEPPAAILQASSVDEAIQAAEAALNESEPIPAPQAPEVPAAAIPAEPAPIPSTPEPSPVEGKTLKELELAARLTRSEERRAEISAEIERRANPQQLPTSAEEQPAQGAEQIATPQPVSNLDTNVPNLLTPLEQVTAATNRIRSGDSSAEAFAAMDQAREAAAQAGASQLDIMRAIERSKPLIGAPEVVNAQPVTQEVPNARAVEDAAYAPGAGTRTYEPAAQEAPRGEAERSISEATAQRAQESVGEDYAVPIESTAAVDVRQSPANGEALAAGNAQGQATGEGRADTEGNAQEVAPVQESPAYKENVQAAPLYEDYAAPKDITATKVVNGQNRTVKTVLKGQTRTFRAEKSALLFAKQQKLKGYTPREIEPKVWVLSRPAKPALTPAEIAQRRRDRTIVRSTDSAQRIIEKSGGWKWEDAARDGVDPKERKGRSFLFRTNGGLTMDGIAEVLDSHGFDVRDENGAIDATRAREIMEQSLSGPVYSPEGMEIRKARDAEARSRYEARHNRKEQLSTGYANAAQEVQSAIAVAVDDAPLAISDIAEEQPEEISDEELAKWLSEGEAGGNPASADTEATGAGGENRQANAGASQENRALDVRVPFARTKAPSNEGVSVSEPNSAPTGGSTTSRDSGGDAPVAGRAEQKLRDAFGALPSVSLGKWYPLTVEHNGRAQKFLAGQRALARNKPAAIHFLQIRPGRLMAGDKLVPRVYHYKLDGNNQFEQVGIPTEPTAELSRMWADAFETPALSLTGETESEIRTREALAAKEAEAKRKQESAPSEKDFTLTGSDRQVDVAEARGQKSLFARKQKVPLPYDKQIDTPAFRRWFGKSKVVDENGRPLVVYHGTPNDFTSFDPKRGNIESDFGAGLYFSNTREDVAANYADATKGPDLTQKIELRAERIEQDADGKLTMEQAREMARSEMAQHGGATMPVYLSIQKPFVLGGENETILTFEFEYEGNDPESDITGSKGTLVDFLNALRASSEDFSDIGDLDGLIANIEEAASYDSIGASELMKLLKDSEPIAYAIDEDGNLGSHELVRRAIEGAGFDGVIDHTVDEKFGSQRRVGRQMEGVNEETVHYIAFRPEQVKSAIGNRGTFDKNNSDIRFAQAKPEATPSLSVEDIRATVTPIVLGWRNQPHIKIIESFDNAPPSVRDEAHRTQNAEAEGRPYAFFYEPEKTIYLVRDQIRSQEQVITGLLHEGLGHYGLRGVFGDRLNVQLAQLAALRPEDIKAKAKAYGLDILDPEDKILAAEEVLAELAQTRPEISFVRRAIAAIRTWLRETFPSLKLSMSDDEIVRNFILPARDFVERGESKDVTGDGKAKFARTKPAETTQWAIDDPSRIENIIYKLQDRHIDTRSVLKAIRETGKALADHVDAYLQEELYHGRAAKRTEDFANKELKPLLTDMVARGVKMQNFETYLLARHAEEANKHIAERRPDLQDGGSSMKTEEAKKYLAGLSDRDRRAYEALAIRVDKIVAETRNTLVRYGLESADTVKGWAEQFKHYVPLNREDMGNGQGIGQGFSVKGPSSKARTGSTRKVVDILANIAMQRERAIVRGEKNRVATALVGLAAENPNPEFWMVDKPPTIKTVDEKTNTVVERTDPMYKSRENVIVARIPKDGKIIERAVIFNEDNERAKRMALALKNLDTDQLNGVMQVSAKISRYFASVNTQYNPVFGIVNLERDVASAMANLSSTPLAGQQKAVLAYTMSALKGIYLDIRAERKGEEARSKWADLWEEFQREGGKTGYRDMFADSKERAKALEREIKRAQEGKAKASVRAVFDWLSDYNTTMENAVRLAAYKVGKENGLSNQRAASLAKNLTVNFNRKGQITTQAGALYAFFNANVQGSARMIETLRGPGGRKIIIGGITLGVMQAVLLAMAGFDDDEPPEFEREKNLIIPTGKKTYIKIPMPLGLHILPNIGRISTEYVLGGFKNSGKRASDLIGTMFDAFNPVGSSTGLSLGSVSQLVSPTALDPLTSLAVNEDWTGRPIARKDRDSLHPTPGHTRGKDTSTQVAKWASEGINYLTGGTKYKAGVLSPTPDQIDYLIGQVTGGVGREIAKAEQTAASFVTGEKLPENKALLVSRFYGNADSPGSKAHRFYEYIRELNEHQAEIEGRRKAHQPIDDYLKDNPEANLYRYGDTTERIVSSLHKRKRDLVAKDAPREEIERIDARIEETMTRFNNRIRQAKKAEVAQPRR